MQKLLFIITLIVPCYLYSSPLPDYPFVFTRGEAEREVIPNIVLGEFQIILRHENSEKALQLMEQRSVEVTSILTAEGVNREDIVGFNIHKNRLRNYEQRNQFAFLGYEVTRKVEFTLRALTKYEPIFLQLLQTADVVELQSRFDHTDRKNIETGLLASAVTNAKAKAEAIAQSSNQRIVRLRAISPLGFINLGSRFGLGNQQRFSRIASNALQNHLAPQELLFIPATLKFSNSVSVIYELTTKE